VVVWAQVAGLEPVMNWNQPGWSHNDTKCSTDEMAKLPNDAEAKRKAAPRQKAEADRATAARKAAARKRRKANLSQSKLATKRRRAAQHPTSQQRKK